MTAADILVPATIAAFFVIAWFVLGIIDSTRDDPSNRPADPAARVASEKRLIESR